MTRQRLENTRHGITHRVTIGGTDIVIRTGEYEDGQLGELFIDLEKEGDQLRVYDIVAIMISIGLQHGIPLESFIKNLEFQNMEPRGITSNADIPMVKSISDYLAKWLKQKYGKKEAPNASER